MFNFRITTFLVIAFVALFGCSQANKPSSTELKNALSLALPGYIEVTDFSIEASQNIGNEVEPVYGSRFSASVIAKTNLYKADSNEKNITFVRLATEIDKKTDIFGKVVSRLYQGAWKHNVDIDGTPIRNLGLPLNQVSAARVIVRGSDEENKYYAEIEQKKKERQIERERREAEFRKNIANADNIFVGTWREKCGTEEGLLNYKNDGTFSANFNDKDYVGVWSVEGDLINVNYKNLEPETWKIIDINNNYYEIKNQRQHCKATRIK